MTGIKNIVQLMLTLALATLSMNMTWLENEVVVATGKDLGASYLLVPLVIVCGLSIIGLIKNKEVNIIVHTLSVSISVLLIIFLIGSYLGMVRGVTEIKGMIFSTTETEFGWAIYMMILVSVWTAIICGDSLESCIKFDSKIVMTTQKRMLYLVTILVLGVLAMNVPWMKNEIVDKTGKDLGVSYMLVPFIIICVLSIIGFIKNRIINIIVDGVSIIISVLLTVFLIYGYVKMISQFGSIILLNFVFGFGLLIVVSVEAVVVSIMSLRVSIKLENKITNKRQANSILACKKCGHDIPLGLRFCMNCALQSKNDVIENRNKIKEVNQETDIIFCMWCGGNLNNGGQFCGSCGKKIAIEAIV